MPDMGCGLVHPGSAEEECAADGAAGSTSEVVADSMEGGGCAVGDVMDDVSSADVGQQAQHRPLHAQQGAPHAQQAQHNALQWQQQQAQQLSLMTVGEQGRAVGPAGLGQLLSGDIQWVGSAIDAPTQLGLTPSQHQTYYKAFSRVRCVPLLAAHCFKLPLEYQCNCALNALKLLCSCVLNSWNHW